MPSDRITKRLNKTPPASPASPASPRRESRHRIPVKISGGCRQSFERRALRTFRHGQNNHRVVFSQTVDPFGYQ